MKRPTKKQSIRLAIFLAVVLVITIPLYSHAKKNLYYSYIDTADQNFTDKNMVEAIANLTAAMEIYPKRAETYAGRAYGYYSTKAYDEALKDIQTSLVLKDSNPNYLFKLEQDILNAKNEEKNKTEVSVALSGESVSKYMPTSALEEAHHIFQEDERLLHLTTVSPTTGFATGLKAYPKLTWKTETVEESAGRTSIAMTYPKFNGGETVAKLNQFISDTIHSQIDEDRQDLKELMAYDPDSFESTLDVASHYRVRGATNGIASIELVITDFTGGGNGNHDWPILINWDLKSNKLLKLPQELFCDANYLATLVPLVRKQLTTDFEHSPYVAQPLDPSLVGGIQEGTEPNSDNWNDNFLLSKEGLIAVFAPYHITSGSAGIIRVLIPYSAIPNLLCVPLDTR